MMNFKCCWSNLLLILILLVPCNVYASLNITKIPKQGYCADAQCQEPIAIASPTIKFNSAQPHVLSSSMRDTITLYSRIDDAKLFVLVTINGKRGFFPPKLFRVTKVKVRTEEVNVPVEFIIDETNTIVIKPLSIKTNASSSEASNVSSSINSDVNTSLPKPLTISNIPLEDDSDRGFFFTHASAAEASESQSSGYAPGHSPEFPAPKDPADVDGTVLPSDAPGDPSAGYVSSKLENKSPEAEVGENIASSEAIPVNKQEAPKTYKFDNESSTEETESASAGIEDDDEDDEDDEDLRVESEYHDEHSLPHIHTVQSSINDKTEMAETNIVTPTPPVHPSTPAEGSAESETPVRTQPVPSSGLPPFSSSQPPFPLNIQASKPPIPEVSASDASTLAPPSDDVKKETSLANLPEKSEEIIATKLASENLQAPKPSLNVTEANGKSNETTPSPAESVYVNVASTPTADSDSSILSKMTSNQTDEISPTEKSGVTESPLTTANASVIGTLEPQASPHGNNLTGEPAAGLSKEDTTDKAASLIPEQSKPESTEQIHQHTLPPDTASSTNNTVESSTPPGAPVEASNQPDIPAIQNANMYSFYRLNAGGFGQQQPQPVDPAVQPPVDQFHGAQPPVNQQFDVLPPTDQPYQSQVPVDAGQSAYPYGQPPSDQPPTAQPSGDQNPFAQPGDRVPPPLPSVAPPTGSSLYDALSSDIPSESSLPNTGESPVDNKVITEDYDTTTVEPTILEGLYQAPEQSEVLPEDAESSSSWWDSVFSLFSSPKSPADSFADTPPPKLPDQPDQYSANSAYPPQQDVPPSPAVTTCSDGSLGPDCPQESFLPFQVDDLFHGLGVDSLMTRIIAAAFTLLLCIVAYFFFENRRMDGSLVARVNTLEREIMVLSKENTLLKEECASNIGEGQLEIFLRELEEAKAVRADLEEQVATLERDLDEAAEANMELNQMLAQTLEGPKGSTDDVLASVERLQAQLDGQRDTIGNMTRSLSSKNAEIEGLKVQITECRETISGLEAEVATLNETVSNLRREKEDANIAHVEKLQEVQNQLAEALANKVLEESRLGSELSSVKLNLKKTRQIVVAKESEVEALKVSLKELKSAGVSEEKLAKLFDAVKLHAQVEQLTQERNELEDSLRGEGDARKRLEDHVRVIEEEVNKLRVNYEEAQKEKNEAQTRLEVLSNYFKDKEAQLKKELDLHEVLLAQQRGDENSVLRQVQSLQEEVETYRSQNESLKREILDQERDFKGQIATIEKKSHDNWVSARQAERKLEESRQEASQLRNRLTLVEKNLSSSGEAGGAEANGEGGIVSPVMGLPGMGPMGALMGPMGPMIPPPPPPIDLDSSSGLPPFMFPPLSPGSLPHHSLPFIPPLPPPPLLAGDRRPPPLGRMSSPPPAPPPPPGHFSPPPPHFDRLDRPSQSPSPTYHRSPAGGERSGFRPFAKPSPRKATDYRGSYLSSSQSNESAEKTRTNEHV